MKARDGHNLVGVGKVGVVFPGLLVPRNRWALSLNPFRILFFVPFR
jgi:hypothetical protein